MEQRGTLKQEKHSQTGNKRVPAVLAVLAAAVLLCMGIFLWGRHDLHTPFDPNATDNLQKPLSEEEMLRELQKAADESAFRFKIDSEVTVVEEPNSGSHQTANWNIINSIENSCNMQVTITGEDGTVLYESQILRPGEQELSGALQTELAATTPKHSPKP